MEREFFTDSNCMKPYLYDCCQQEQTQHHVFIHYTVNAQTAKAIRRVNVRAWNNTPTNSIQCKLIALETTGTIFIISPFNSIQYTVRYLNHCILLDYIYIEPLKWNMLYLNKYSYRNTKSAHFSCIQSYLLKTIYWTFSSEDERY